ncbi:F-box/TPR repeat protein Pof3 [Microdochium nivale]|nr:F-box/TPR repeat protein Pof3 [Microdochium nivale]
MATVALGSIPQSGCPPLPTEILHQICHYLCAFCHEHPGLDADGSGTRALAALCLVSKSFAAVAQPHVYHVASGLSSGENLIRTLCERADLARHVRTFNSDNVYHTSDRWTHYLELVGSATRLGLLADGEEFPAPKYERFGHLFDQLLFILATRLENLRIEISDAQLSEGLEYSILGKRVAALRNRSQANEPTPEAPLSHLRVLYLHTHYDWGYGLEIPAIATVLEAAAPTLEQLIVSRCTDSSFSEDGALRHIQLPRLKVLALDGCAFEGENSSHLPLFKHFCESTSQLEEFHYIAASAWIGENLAEYATALDLVRCVRSCAETLRAMTLDISAFASAMVSRPKLPARSLAEFERLEELRLEDTSFCHHLGEPDSAATPRTCLTGLLPASIKRLVVRMYDGTPAWGDLHELAEHVMLGRFPELQDVRVLVSLRSDQDIGSESALFQSRYLVASEALQAVYKDTRVVLSTVQCSSWGGSSDNIDTPWRSRA